MANPKQRVAVAITIACAVIAAALFLIPAWIIQPFRSQAQNQLALALAIRRIAPLATILLFAVGVACVLYIRPRRWSAAISVLAIVVTAVAAAAVRVNYFELMFHPNPTPQFVGVSDANLEADDMVMVARIGKEARAYPVRIMAYHHLLNDTVSGVPIVPTYWTLCHTGLVWKRTAAGRTLTFHLAGINNQNFLMRDDETGSYWQQVTGRAIAGPLKGQALQLLGTDEVTFAVFREEDPNGSVLAPLGTYARQYAKKDWEQGMKRARTVISFPGQGLADRDLVLGIQVGNASRAYLANDVLQKQVIQDELADKPIVLVAGPDGRSVRAFISKIGDRNVELFREQKPDWALIDSETASKWDFRGCAVDGTAQGECLESVGVLRDYWFDWRNYHPETTVFRRGTTMSQ